MVSDVWDDCGECCEDGSDEFCDYSGEYTVRMTVVSAMRMTVVSAVRVQW